MTELLEALKYDFMQHALMAGVLAAIVCGIIGTLVVVNRLVFLAGGIAHAAYGGLGIAVLAGFAPMLGAVGFAVFVALIMAWATRDRRTRTDAATGVLWAFGMALGVILMDLDKSGGYKADLMSYLFGGVLTVAPADLLAMAIFTVILVVMAVFFYQRFLAMAYDEEYAESRGLATGWLFSFLLVLTAIAVVLLIRIVGLLLVIALLSIAPYIAERRCGSIGQMMFVSMILNLIFIMGGIALAYRFNFTSGPAIIVVGAFFFTIDEAVHRLTGSRR